MESISRTYYTMVLNCDNVHAILITLKQRIAPTDRAKSIDLVHQYHRLFKVGRQNVEAWLQQWEKVYGDCVLHNVPEVSGHRALYDFLGAVTSIDSVYSTYWKGELAKRTYEGTILPEFYELVELFRNQQRLTSAQSGKLNSASHSAFASFQGQSLPEDSSPSSSKPAPATGKSKEPWKPCICGIVHWFRQCPYILEAVRPKGWKPDPKIQKVFDDKLKSNGHYRSLVAKLRTEPPYEGPKPTEQPAARKPQEPVEMGTGQMGAYMTTMAVYDTSAKPVYSLQNSFILDSAATGHVCNSRSRMTDLRPATDQDKVFAGNILIPIEAFGSVVVTVSTPTGTGRLTLMNVALISSFHTSIVALCKFVDKGITWNIDAGELITKNTGRIFCYIQRKHSQWVMEYQPITAFATPSTAPRADKVGTEELWLRRLGHPGPTVLEHLSESVTGIKLNKGPTTVNCEECAVSKAHAVISRRPNLPTTRPYQRVHLDLVQLAPAFNGDRWFVHFFCDYTKMNHVYTITSKSQSFDVVRSFAAYIKTQFSIDV